MEIKNFKINKIISAVFYALALAFSAVYYIDVAVTGGDWQGLGYAITLLLSVYAFAIAIIPSLIGLIRSIVGVKKGYCEKATLIYFIVFTALPIVTWLISYILIAILL